jgi:hypothetical protein
MKRLLLVSLPLACLLAGVLAAGEKGASDAETAGGWAKSEKNPVLGGQLGACFDVSVLHESDKYRMWFSWRPKKSIALVESDDGLAWGEPTVVLGPNKASGWEGEVNRPPAVSTAQAAGAGLPPLSVPKSPEPAEEAHSPGTVFAVLRVTDFGTRVERQERQVVARLPERKVETITASPGWAILGVKLPQPANSALENLQVIVTRDRSAVELTADRSGGNGGDTKGARPSPLETVAKRGQTP